MYAMASYVLLVGLNRQEWTLKSASHMGSRIIRRASCTIRSNRIGIPSGLFLSLFGLGMYTLRTGHGSKVSALSVVLSSLMYPSKFPRKFDMFLPSIPAVSLPLFCWT